jgi:hypothetical protein
MPYKDPYHKRQWESQHRARRLARRRELRRIAVERKAAQPEPPGTQESAAGILWLPVAGGVALAAFNPKLAIGAGGLTLAAAATLKKSWAWWMVGLVALALGLFFQWNNPERK